MGIETEVNAGNDGVSPIEQGKAFIRWGLSLFTFGLFVGLVPIVHYMHGAVAGDVGAHFMKNMTLWWGCPAVLMELTLKAGGLGMAVIGICYVVLPRSAGVHISGNERLAPKLCNVGLIFATAYMAVGYVVFNMIWPNFYFAHHELGKDLWLAGQLLGIVVFVAGYFFALRGVRRHHLQ
jgi:hypothetical protein